MLTRIKLHGQSMYPTLRDKDIILLKHIAFSEIKKRDIILFKNEHNAVVHRVVKIKKSPSGTVLYAKGDYAEEIEKISDSDVCAKVIGIERGERLKILLFENTALYCFFMNQVAYAKRITAKVIDKTYSFSFFRKILKKFLPLKADCVLVRDISCDDNFNSFYNLLPSAMNSYVLRCGFIAKRNHVLFGKLFVFSDSNDDFFLYGPYVKILYRSRGIGKILLEEAIRYLKSKAQKEYIYAIAFHNRAPARLLRKSGFSLVSEKEFSLFRI